MPRDDDDDLEDLKARRRARRAASNRRTTIVAVVVAAAVVGPTVLGLAAWGVTRAVRTTEKVADAGVVSVTGPRAEKEGEAWSHKELLDYFATKLGPQGTVVTIQQVNTAAWSGPVADFKIAYRGRSKTVTVQKRKSAQDAKDVAGPQSGDWHWGRFLFTDADDEIMAMIRDTLPS